MFTTVAVLPQPPLLVPELATGAVAETAALRAACVTAAARLGNAARRWIAVGADQRGRATVQPGAHGTFAGFGVDVPVALDTTGSRWRGTAAHRVTGAPPHDPTERTTCADQTHDMRRRNPRHAEEEADETDPEMALPLLIAGWVAGAAGVEVTIRGELIAPDAPPDDCAALGAALAAEAAAATSPVALLVVGDGAATHGEKAPGHLDNRAGPFDRAVAEALATGDRAALAGLDAGLAGELVAVGRAPWQVLAAAAAGGRWRGELLHSAAPYGVAYHVAVWTRRP